MNLNQHGAACRCLLRLCENEGAPGISDAAFIARFGPRYPEWQMRPGATNLISLLEIARELRLADGADVFRDYDRVLQEHRDGNSILVATERAPGAGESASDARRFFTLLVDIDETAFTLWCPYPSGLSDVLPRAVRSSWDAWLAIGIILQRPEARR